MCAHVFAFEYNNNNNNNNNTFLSAPDHLSYNSIIVRHISIEIVVGWRPGSCCGRRSRRHVLVLRLRLVMLVMCMLEVQVRAASGRCCANTARGHWWCGRNERRRGRVGRPCLMRWRRNATVGMSGGYHLLLVLVMVDQLLLLHHHQLLLVLGAGYLLLTARGGQLLLRLRANANAASLSVGRGRHALRNR